MPTQQEIQSLLPIDSLRALPSEETIHEVMGLIDRDFSQIEGDPFGTTCGLTSTRPGLPYRDRPHIASLTHMWLGPRITGKPALRPELMTTSETFTLPHPLRDGGNLYTGLLRELPPDIFNYLYILDPEANIISVKDFSSGAHLFLYEGMINRTVDCFNYRQRQVLLRELISKGYTQPQDPFQLVEEITTRQTQFPGSKIYVLLGNSLAHFTAQMDLARKWDGAIPIGIHSNGIHYSSGAHLGFGPFDSAVVSSEQIDSGHSFHHYYSLHRTPRRWTICNLFVMKLSLKVQPYPGKIPEIKREEKRPADQRFIEIIQEGEEIR